jgi:hypothetical protein
MPASQLRPSTAKPAVGKVSANPFGQKTEEPALKPVARKSINNDPFG